MKKNYIFGMLAALLMVFTPANAQIGSMAELFGTYKMTATMTVTNDGQELKDLFTDECEVTIGADESGIGWDAAIIGFADATNQLNVNGLNAEGTGFKIQNWGTSSYWGSGIYMSTAEGLNGWASTLPDLYFTYDADAKEISVPDFTLVKMADYSATHGTILASFTNVKLTLDKAEAIEIVDLSGEWTATAGSGAYSTMEGSEYPTEYSFTLTKTSEEAAKHNYTMDLTIADFAPVQLPATFDGVALVAELDMVYLDEPNLIYLSDFNGLTITTLKFTVSSPVKMTMDGALCLRQTIDISGVLSVQRLQWWMDGFAKKAVDEFNWEGTFKFKAGNINVIGETGTYPEEFEMNIVKNAYNDKLYILSMFGDCNAINYGGIPVEIDEVNPKIAYVTTGKYCGKYAEGVYYTLNDANGGTETLKMTVGEDGTITLDNFKVTLTDFTESIEGENYAIYESITGAAKVEEPYDFTGIYDVTATVESLDGETYPEAFEMQVTWSDYTESYYITYFLDNDVYASNYGGIPMAATGNVTAEITTDKYAGTIIAGEHYLKLFDAEGGKETIKVEVVDGNLSIADFTIYHLFFGTNSSLEEGAKYTNIVAVKSDKDAVSVESVVAQDKANVSVVNGNVVVAGAVQQVVVFDAAGCVQFSGVTNCVSGLAKGLHIVKVGNSAVKVNIK